MEFTIRIDDSERTVHFREADAGYSVAIADRVYQVSKVALEDGLVSFLIDGKSRVAYVTGGDTGAELTMRGRRYRVAGGGAVDAASSAGSGGNGRLEAPMPGSIVSVHASEGDEVAAGDPIVVLESMKMQNEISCPVAGTVKKIYCAAGQQVGFGELLVEVEPVGGP